MPGFCTGPGRMLDRMRYGLIQGLRRELPDLPLHGSTQLGIGDIPGARLLQRLGFSCGVLARETSLSSIAAIRRAVDLPWRPLSTGPVHELFRRLFVFFHGGGAQRQPGHLRPAL